MNYRYKVGIVSKKISEEADIPSGNIFIDDYHIMHIQKKHGKELSSVGMDAMTFVKCVCQNYNQIRRGADNSLLLVVYNDSLSLVAAMDLVYSHDKGFWEIKTAQPRSSHAVLKKALLWTGAQAVCRYGPASH